MSLEVITDTAKILSDTTRVKILLALKKSGGMCVSEIADTVDASHSATSHQLAKMEAKGIVICFREGQKMCYELSKKRSTNQIMRTLSFLY